MRNRVATVAAGVTICVATLCGVANAAPHNLPYRPVMQGPYADQTTCNALSAEHNQPPDVISSPCSFYEDNPGPANHITGGGSGPGWYYEYRYLIA
jgi:hypothetical protein